ncbi:MAG: LPXTG cell wall anchor domain-containing protein [Clostridiales bacterium]|nr:LPXTG cell wall anchor domain-containing protein [Clostridiales bacterium]
MRRVSAVSKFMTAAAALCTVLLFFGFRVNAEFRHAEIQAVVPFTCENVNYTANEYEIVIEKLDEASPLPDVVTKKISAGDDSFTIGIDEPGTYQYKVYENAGTDSKITYDDTTYIVTLFVTSDDAGKLDYKVILSKGGMVKPSEITFVNKVVRVPIVKTGETANSYMPFAFAAFVLAGIVLILAFRRRKEDQDV